MDTRLPFGGDKNVWELDTRGSLQCHKDAKGLCAAAFKLVNILM